MKHTFTRRRFAATAGAFASLVFGSGCDRIGHALNGASAAEANDGRLTVRPPTKATAVANGEHALGFGKGRDAIVRVPPHVPEAPLPLLVLLHGAGGSGAGVLRRLSAAADQAGVAVLAPDSRDQTWDAIRGRFGADVTFLNRALERTFEMVSVDPARVAVGGFSDGATYAISIGLINGDLFRRVIAFSPGFVVDGASHGTPRFFVSHGTVDRILPIDQCSRVIVPALRRHGYEVNFKEFDGGHTVPPDIAAEAMRWLAGM
jgi:phospholipase/carboxylesterase